MPYSLNHSKFCAHFLAVVFIGSGCVIPENAPRAIRVYHEHDEAPRDRLDEERQLAEAAKSIGNDFSERNPGSPRLSVAVLPFSFHSGKRDHFTARTTDALSRQVSRERIFIPINRSRIDSVLEEHRFVQNSGIISRELAAEMSRGMGAQAVLTGKIYEYGTRWKLELQLISVEKTIELANGVAELSRPQPVQGDDANADAQETGAFLFVPKSTRSSSGAVIKIMVTNRSPISRYIRFPLDERRTYLTDGVGRQHFPDSIEFGGLRHNRGDLLGPQPEQEILPTRGARVELLFSNIPKSGDMELTLHYRYNNNDKFVTFNRILR